MTTETLLREGPVVTADTRTAIITLGANASPGVMKTPSDKHRISYLLVACAVGETPAGTTGGVLFIRLAGGALPEEYAIMVGGCAEQIATAGEAGSPGFAIAIPVGFELKVPGEYLEVYGEIAGVDACDPNFNVAPLFE